MNRFVVLSSVNELVARTLIIGMIVALDNDRIHLSMMKLLFESANIERGIIISNVIQVKISTHDDNGSVNAYVMPDKPVTLIDTGLPTKRSFQQLKSGLASVGFSLTDLDQVIITHMHDDHSGGISQIQREVNIPVFVHDQAKQELTEEEAGWVNRDHFMKQFFEQCGAGQMTMDARHHKKRRWRNVKFLKDGDRIFAGGKNFSVLYTPGHSQTDICLWDTASGDVFVGDFLLKHISSNAFISEPAPGQEGRPKPLLQLRNSFNSVYNLSFAMMYSGHGSPFRGHQQLIDKRLTEQKERCKEIYQLIQSGFETVNEMCEKMFPWLNGNSKFLGFSEIQGHLDLMIERHQICAKPKGDAKFYKIFDQS